MSQSTWNQSVNIGRARTASAAFDLTIPSFWQYVLAVLLLSALRLGGLTHQSLWFDEGYTLHLVSAESFPEFLRIFGSYTTSEHLQPLYYFLMYAWSRVAGASDTALRLPSALFSIGSGLCVFAFVRQMVSRSIRLHAGLAVALFSISSYSVFYAQEARPYACIQCFSFLFMLSWLVQARQRYQSGKSDARATAFFAASSALVCLSSIFGALLFVCVGSADLYYSRKDLGSWWSSWRVSCITAVTFSFAYAVFAYHSFPSVVAKDIVGLKQPLWMNAAYALFGTMFGSALGPSTAELHGPHKFSVMMHALPVLALAGLVVLGLAWALSRIAASSNMSFYARVGSLTTALYAVLLFGGFGIVGKLNILPRHASALFAACVTAMCACVLSRRNRRSHVPKTVLVVSLGAAALLNALSLVRSISANTYRKDDYRAVAAELAGETRPIYLVGGQELLFRHYGRDVHSAVEVEPEQLDHYLKQATRSSAEIVVVMNTFRNYRWDGGPSLEAMLQRDYACASQSEYAYFHVLTCTLHDGATHREVHTNE